MGENFGISRDTASGEILYLQLLASFTRVFCLWLRGHWHWWIIYFVTFCGFFFFYTGCSRKEITEHWEWLEQNLLQTLSIFENENDINTFVRGKIQVVKYISINVVNGKCYCGRKTDVNSEQIWSGSPQAARPFWRKTRF